MAGSDAEVIAAVATASGRAGIGIVRVSGKTLDRLSMSLLGRVPAPRTAVRATFRGADGQPIDDGIAVFFPAPASYTGEDVLELQGHGGPVVLQMLLRRCVELGARLAEPGEFTRRAFLNDKLDLAQAEGVADLIEAATEAAARCALRSLRGEFSELIGNLTKRLVELRTLVEATLDFPEEEIDPVDREDVRRRLKQLQEDIARSLESGRRGSVLRSGLQVVLAGQEDDGDVGKSFIVVDEFADFVARAHGHKNIRQNHVGLQIGNLAHGGFAIPDAHHFDAFFLQGTRDDLLDVATVVGYQNRGQEHPRGPCPPCGSYRDNVFLAPSTGRVNTK